MLEINFVRKRFAVLATQLAMMPVTGKAERKHHPQQVQPGWIGSLRKSGLQASIPRKVEDEYRD